MSPGTRSPRLALAVQYGVRASGLPSQAQLRRWARAALERDAHVTVRIVGGREEGFGGYAYKQNWSPGDWRVAIETEDGREIGRTRFEIRPDPQTDERVFDVLRN